MSLTTVQQIAKQFVNGNPMRDNVYFYNDNIIFVFDNDYSSEEIRSYYYVNKNAFPNFNPNKNKDYTNINRFHEIHYKVSDSLKYGGFENVEEPVFCESKSNDDFWVFEYNLYLSD